jgi:hypothetical protein
MLLGMVLSCACMISSITILEASTRACRSSRVEAAKAELAANRSEKLRNARVFFIVVNLIIGAVPERRSGDVGEPGNTGDKPENAGRRKAFGAGNAGRKPSLLSISLQHSTRRQRE